MSHLQAIPTRVYVGNLHHSARERDLERFFKSCGRIKEILIKKNYGFVVRNQAFYLFVFIWDDITIMAVHLLYHQ